jgi:hypothetical protein
MSQPTRNERDRIDKKDNDINEADRYPAAHNCLVGGLGFPIPISARPYSRFFRSQVYPFCFQSYPILRSMYKRRTLLGLHTASCCYEAREDKGKFSSYATVCKPT